MVDQYQRVDFRDQIAKNKRKSFFLIVIIFIVFLAFGGVIGLALGGDYVFIVMIASIVISIIYVLISYNNSSKIALASVRARKIDTKNPDEKQYERVVEGLTIASGLPMPKLYVMESDGINAFASGKNPKDAVIPSDSIT